MSDTPNHLPECKMLSSWHRDTGGMYWQRYDGYDCAPGCPINEQLRNPKISIQAALRYIKERYSRTATWQGWTPHD